MACDYLFHHHSHLVDSLSIPTQVVTGLIFTPVINEFTFKGPFLKLGQNIGLLVGAVFWGIGSDIWGRRYHPSALSSTSRHEPTN
jgi:hypothetical protein